MSAASSRASTGADDKAASSERPEPATDEIPRTIGLLSLAALTFFTISSGPYGLEDAVGAAGALPVLIGILTLSVVWGLPQALVTGASLTVRASAHEDQSLRTRNASLAHTRWAASTVGRSEIGRSRPRGRAGPVRGVGDVSQPHDRGAGLRSRARAAREGGDGKVTCGP